MLAGTGPAGPDSRGRRYHAEWLHHALVEGTARRLVWSWCHRVRGHTPHRLGAALSNAAAHAEEQGHGLWRHTCHTCQDVWWREVHQGSFQNWCRPQPNEMQMKPAFKHYMQVVCVCGGGGVMWLGMCHGKWEKDSLWFIGCVCVLHTIYYSCLFILLMTVSQISCVYRGQVNILDPW